MAAPHDPLKTWNDHWGRIAPYLTAQRELQKKLAPMFAHMREAQRILALFDHPRRDPDFKPAASRFWSEPTGPMPVAPRRHRGRPPTIRNAILAQVRAKYSGDLPSVKRILKDRGLPKEQKRTLRRALKDLGKGT
jgi:hypothetical protein